MPKWESTNMPLFGRAHECKEYEHWNEKKSVNNEGERSELYRRTKETPIGTLVTHGLTQVNSRT